MSSAIPDVPVRTRYRLVLATLAAVAAVLPGVAGCAKQPPAIPVPSTAGAFDATDRAWIELTIAMDEQIRPLLDLVPRRGADRALPALAGQVRAIIDAELPTSHLLRDQAGLPTQNPHEGMVMPGLVTADEVARAATLRGTEFDAFAATTVREYLAHGADLARSETKNGQEFRTKALAATALRMRTRALSALPSAPS
jgi:hypothetical protein